MPIELHLVMRLAHIVLGLGGFVLGAVAITLPKFGPPARWHRLVGRGYAVSMLCMGALSIPLSIRQGNVVLIVIGPLTVLWVMLGWAAMAQFRRARARGQREAASTALRRHINMMGSSYIAAWTAFLVNVQPLGGGSAVFWVYALGPSLIGSLLIARAIRSQSRPLAA